jgi:hypothetical protein
MSSNDLLQDLNNIITDYSTLDDVKNLETINPKSFKSKTKISREVADRYNDAIVLINLYLNLDFDNKRTASNIDPGFVCCLLYNDYFIIDVSVDFSVDANFDQKFKNITNNGIDYDDKLNVKEKYFINKIYNQIENSYLSLDATISKILYTNNFKSFISTTNGNDIIKKYLTFSGVQMLRKNITTGEEYTDDLIHFSEKISSLICTQMWNKLIQTVRYDDTNIPIDLFLESLEFVIDNYFKIINDNDNNFDEFKEPYVPSRYLDLLPLPTYDYTYDKDNNLIIDENPSVLSDRSDN